MRSSMYSQIMASAIAIASITVAWPALAQVDAAAAGMSQDRLKRATQILDNYIAKGQNAGSVGLVYRKGHLAYVEARGFQDLAARKPMQRDSIFNLASMTKPVTAVAAMILVEDGKLSLDEPIDKYIPELANRQVLIDPAGSLTQTRPSPRAITLRDLLTQTTGLGWPEAAGISSDAPITKAYMRADGPNMTADALLANLQTLPLIYPPGEHFLYNTSYSVLGVLVERASGMSLDTFFKARIFSPLGMVDSGFVLSEDKLRRRAKLYMKHDGAGPLILTEDQFLPDGSGGLLSTADDYLKFARMLMGSGKVDGVRILSRKSVELMTHDQIEPALEKSFFYAPGFFNGSGYGFGLQVQKRQTNLGPSPGAFWWAGSTGVNWVADPAEDLIYIRLVQRNDEFEPFNRDYIQAVYQAIVD